MLKTQRNLDGDGFVADLARRSAIQCESRDPARAA